MKENYKLQNTNYKQITKYNVQNYKQKEDHVLKKLINKPKCSYGLHQGTFKLQTMTALIKSFCGGSRGAVFSKRAPLAAGGRNEE
ncbi:MAG: hypothetical protein PVH61_35840 [Candidatus Aminicenantes bacterium]|jgi:hypothetical protein